MKMTDDRKQLLMLRIAVARAAQAMQYETPQLPVLGKPYEELYDMADSEDFGWKSLLMGAVDTNMGAFFREFEVSDE